MDEYAVKLHHSDTFWVFNKEKLKPGTLLKDLYLYVEQNKLSTMLHYFTHDTPMAIEIEYFLRERSVRTTKDVFDVYYEIWPYGVIKRERDSASIKLLFVNLFTLTKDWLINTNVVDNDAAIYLGADRFIEAYYYIKRSDIKDKSFWLKSIEHCIEIHFGYDVSTVKHVLELAERKLKMYDAVMSIKEYCWLGCIVVGVRGSTIFDKRHELNDEFFLEWYDTLLLDDGDYYFYKIKKYSNAKRRSLS